MADWKLPAGMEPPAPEEMEEEEEADDDEMDADARAAEYQAEAAREARIAARATTSAPSTRRTW